MRIFRNAAMPFLDTGDAGPSVSAELPTRALIDDGSDAVLIDPEFALALALPNASCLDQRK